MKTHVIAAIVAASIAATGCASGPVNSPYIQWDAQTAPSLDMVMRPTQYQAPSIYRPEAFVPRAGVAGRLGICGV